MAQRNSTWVLGVAGSRFDGDTVLCPRARHFIFICLVGAQPRKRPNYMI